jgi:hypothetical protein
LTTPRATGQHLAMLARAHRPLRFVVGTVLLGLGGACTSVDKTHSNPGPESSPQPEPERADKRLPPKSGGCEPPDCHINPGPTELEPKPPDAKVPDAKVPDTKAPTGVGGINPGPKG